MLWIFSVFANFRILNHISEDLINAGVCGWFRSHHVCIFIIELHVIIIYNIYIRFRFFSIHVFYYVQLLFLFSLKSCFYLIWLKLIYWDKCVTCFINFVFYDFFWQIQIVNKKQNAQFDLFSNVCFFVVLPSHLLCVCVCVCY